MKVYSVSCKNCGETLQYSLKDLKLHCNHCHSKFLPKEYEESLKNKEFSVSHCKNCGAKIISDNANTKCFYCDSVVTNTKEILKDIDYVLPFTIKEDLLLTLFEENGRFTSNQAKLHSFFRRENIVDIKPFYVPIKLFNMDLNVEYQKENMQKKIRFEFENIMLDGSILVDNKQIQKLEPFYYQNLVKFNPTYLLGVDIEKYSDTAESMDSYLDKRLQDIIQRNDPFEKSTVQKEKKVKKEKYCLLPLYQIETQYRNQKAYFLVNGTTGKCITFHNIYRTNIDDFLIKNDRNYQIFGVLLSALIMVLVLSFLVPVFKSWVFYFLFFIVSAMILFYQFEKGKKAKKARVEKEEIISLPIKSRKVLEDKKD